MAVNNFHTRYYIHQLQESLVQAGALAVRLQD
jgi:hypothetical protein